MEEGFKDIYRDTPYYDGEHDGEKFFIHMFYVPPSMRGKGEGKKMFAKLLESIPKEVKYIRLKATTLGSGDTLPFWKSLGFKQAFICQDESTARILNKGVNGFEAPALIDAEGEEKHYIFD